MSQFIRFNKTNPCPVCGTGTKGCSHDTRSPNFANGLFFCRGEQASNLFHYLKETNNGWSLYAYSTDVEDNRKSNAVDYAARQKAIREAKKASELAEKTRLSKLADNPTRDTLYKKLISITNLKPAHLNELKKRGLSDRAIELVGYTSLDQYKFYGYEFDILPGFKQGKYVGASGIFCPIYNDCRELIGFQVKTDDASKGKYLWTRTGDTTAHTREGELPMSVTIKSNVIGLSEGTLKPVIASYLHNLTMIGASGGHFPLKQLKETLANLNPFFKLPIIYFVDSNYLGNSEVFKAVTKTLNYVESLGYQTQIADWYQGFDKSQPDIDELSSIKEVRYLTLEEASYFYKNPDKYVKLTPALNFINYLKPSSLLKSISGVLGFSQKPKYLLRTPKKGNYSNIYTRGSLPLNSSQELSIQFEGSNTHVVAEAIRKGYTHILDTSITGSGKTHAAASLTLKDCGIDKGKLIFATSQPRNPQIATLESSFKELPARNKGYDFNESKRTALNKPYRVQSVSENPDIEANCHLADKFILARSKNLESKDICKTCKFSFDCRVKSGEGYGYKKQLVSALQSERLRGNPQGIDESFIDGNTVIVVDEYSQSVNWTQTLNITLHDVQNAVSQLYLVSQDTKGILELSRLLNSIRNFLVTPDTTPYGLLSRGILGHDAFKNIDASLFEDALQAMEALDDEWNSRTLMDSKFTQKEVIGFALNQNWLRIFIEIITGQNSNSSLLKQGTKLTISLINSRWRNVIEKAKAVLWLDATGNRDELALKLGINPSEILVIQQVNTVPSNLTIVNYQGLGKATNQRSDELSKRIKVTREVLKEVHGVDDIGFIDFKKHCDKGDLVHFSDAIGSNAFQTKQAVASIGIPYPSLNQIQLEYETFTGQRLSNSTSSNPFTVYYNSLVVSQVIQEIGRIRANRRVNEDLTHYILGDLDTSFLTELGYSVKTLHIATLSKDACDKQTRTRILIKDALQRLTQDGKSIEEVTQTDLAKELDVSQQNVSKLAKGLGGWQQLKDIINLFINPEPINPSEVLEDTVFMAQSYLPLLFDLNFDDIANELQVIREAYGERQLKVMLGLMETPNISKLFSLILSTLPFDFRRQWLELT